MTAIVAALSCMTAPAATRAEDAAAAEALFQAGKDLMAEENFAEACPKFEASLKLDPSLGTLMNLADCHEKLGLLARAWAEWGEAESQAQRAGDSARGDLAARRRGELDPRVPRLKITPRGAPRDFTIWRDDTLLGAPMLGVDLPVDPGEHLVRVRRGKRIMRTMKVEIAEGERKAVAIDLDEVARPLLVPPPSSPDEPLPDSSSDAPPTDEGKPECPLMLGPSVSAVGPNAIGGLGFAIQPPNACWFEGLVWVGYNYGSVLDGRASHHGLPVLARGRLWAFDTHSFIADLGLGATMHFIEGADGYYSRNGAQFTASLAVGYGYRSEGGFRLAILAGPLLQPGTLSESTGGGSKYHAVADAFDYETDDALGTGFAMWGPLAPFGEISLGYLFR